MGRSSTSRSFGHPSRKCWKNVIVKLTCSLKVCIVVTCRQLTELPSSWLLTIVVAKCAYACRCRPGKIVRAVLYRLHNLSYFCGNADRGSREAGSHNPSDIFKWIALNHMYVSRLQSSFNWLGCSSEVQCRHCTTYCAISRAWLEFSRQR